MAKVLPSLDESEPVHGDLETVLFLTDIHKANIQLSFFDFLSSKRKFMAVVEIYKLKYLL